MTTSTSTIPLAEPAAPVADARARRALEAWLFTLCALIALMVVIGGFVRLSRAGLSIVEWDVVTGVVPPVGQAAWEDAFARYRATPEYHKVNHAMSLAEYRRIYWIEYAHRLAARLVGLAVVLPLAWFLWRGVIPWRRSGAYLVIAALFAFQGFLGWYMVASGLVDRPSVSHFRLTTHLVAALALFALCLWKALDHRYLDHRYLDPAAGGRSTPRRLRWLAASVVAVVLVQIAYGGLVAGLKAGHVSNTWPLMFGMLVPGDLLAGPGPAWEQLVASPTAVHFVHRWLAFGVLAAAIALVAAARRAPGLDALRRAALALTVAVVAQIALGIGVVTLGVPFPAALSHQALAVGVFACAVFAAHRAAHV